MSPVPIRQLVNSSIRQFRIPTVRVCLCLFVALTSLARAQFGPEGEPAPAPAHNDDPIKIIHPTVDKKNNSISIPAAFWNQKLATWVEVAVCGRPSDFLHETILCTTTTKAIMEQAMRDAGFHDADAWTYTDRDFPRIRGDRFLLTLTFTRKNNPSASATQNSELRTQDFKETYCLDELLTFQGWGISPGPYGWMFKGNPGRAQKLAAAAGGEAATNPTLADAPEDRTRIVRDDPQIAIVFKGIQHQSQSYAESPLAYDDGTHPEDFIYPMMRYARNYRLLPAQIYDSNGGVPVTMTFKKVTEEQLLTESARLWHDDRGGFRKYILEQLPIAKQIDKDKSELWSLLPELKKIQATSEETRDALHQDQITGRINVLAANIEKGYTALDAAWARWACDHPVFESTDDNELADLKKQVQQWRDHMNQKEIRARNLAVAQQAAFEARQLERAPQTDTTQSQARQLRGKELEARSNVIIAEDIQPRDYWKWEQGRLEKGDPRLIWKKTIDEKVELLAARNQVATTGLALGRALQSAPQDQIAAARKLYAQALVRVNIATLKIKLIEVEFEIEKRESFTDDPDLPKLQKQKQQLEALIKEAPATQPDQNP